MNEELRPIPKIGDHDCLIAVNSVGICGSDIHFWTEGRIGDFIVTEPLVLGHETSGTITKVGSKVKKFLPGDRVALEVGISCRRCEFCKTGRYNLCCEMKFGSFPPVDGTLTRYFALPEDFCFLLPENVSYDEGAMVEPLAVAVNACKRGKVAVGEKVLIFGSGPIGILCMMVAKATGVYKCCVVDRDAGRLFTANEVGADYTIAIPDDMSETELAQEVENLMDGKPVVSIECSGAEHAIHTGILATKQGGRLVLVGFGSLEVTVPLATAARNEVDIIGTFRYSNSYPTALKLIATGRIDVKPLITHHYKLEQFREAFEVCRTAKDGAVTVIIKCATEEASRFY